MTHAPMPPLVSTDWLAAELGRDDLRVVDASWYLPAMGRDAPAEYRAAHIPGAVFLDPDDVSDPASPLPHMLPPPEQFARQLGSLGVGDAHRVVVYDGSGVNLSAPRVWWMLRVFGHAAAAVLDGGIGKWRREGRPLDSGTVRHAPTRFTARLDASRVRSLAAMIGNLEHRREQVVDARAAARFEGAAPEPRAGLRSGHIPGSRSLPFTDLVSPDGTVLPPEQLAERFRVAGVDPARPVVATCGSGTTACAIVLALELLGHGGAAVYDGSWSEWGRPGPTPVETGPARPSAPD